MTAPIEEQLRTFFEEQPENVIAAYLFGSRARGSAGNRSDADVAVLFAQDPPRTFEGLSLGLEAELERFLELPVQVVTLNHAYADLIHRVLRDGLLLLDRDPSRRIQFEVRARNEYFDLQPILCRYRKQEQRREASRLD
ncbi:MAG: nucleotidyltransferase domain-containing protein [Acidobacteriota bacterium]